MARTGKSSTAGSFCGASTMMDHYNHVHVAIRPRQHRRGWREHRRRLRPAVREVNNYLGVDLPTAHAQSARDLSLALTGAFG